MTEAAACWPVCAPTELVSTLNSCSASGNGSGWFSPLKGSLAVRAIQREGNLIGVAPATEIVMVGKVLVGVQVVGDRALGGGVARQENQLSWLAGVQRQIDHLLVVDDLADAGAVGFHRQRLASTVTCSLTAPTLRVGLIVGFVLTSSTIPGSTKVVKPSFVTSMR